MEQNKQSSAQGPKAVQLSAEQISAQPLKLDRAIGGAGMDRKVGKSTWQKTRRWLPMLVGALLLLMLFGYIAIESRDRSYSIGSNQVLVAPVTSGVFEDFIPIRGRVTP
jgi:HlyD family secretion protein